MRWRATTCNLGPSTFLTSFNNFLSAAAGSSLQLDFSTATTASLKQDLTRHEPKPSIVNQQCVVYLFKCDLCDAGYVRNTKGHLHKRVEGHRQKVSSIYKHYSKEHNTDIRNNFSGRFNVIKKCTNKFDCLVNEMLCIQDLKPILSVQSNSPHAKVFT